MSGWADLGYALSGGIRNEAEAEYAPQLKRNYDAMSALEEANRKRAVNLQRQLMLTNPEAFGLSGAQANMASLNDDIDMRRLGNFQNPHYRAALDRASAEVGLGDSTLGQVKDISPANRFFALANGDVTPTAAVAGNVMYDPTRGTSQDIQPTPLGEAVVVAQNALAGQRQASAGLTRAKTENPERFRAPPKPGKTKVAVPKKGAVVDGYRFKGGDPKNKANWEKI